MFLVECPVFQKPPLRPGCHFGPCKADESGCLVAPDVICESKTE